VEEKEEKWRIRSGGGEWRPSKFKIWAKTYVAHVYLVRHIFFSIFYFCRKKIFNLPYLFTLFEFGDSKNCPTGQAMVEKSMAPFINF
jgi:hypothetical protein